MNPASPVPLRLRTQLTLPLVLLVVCLLGSVALVQWQLFTANQRVAELVAASQSRRSETELQEMAVRLTERATARQRLAAEVQATVRSATEHLRSASEMSSESIGRLERALTELVNSEAESSKNGAATGDAGDALGRLKKAARESLPSRPRTDQTMWLAQLDGLVGAVESAARKLRVAEADERDAFAELGRVSQRIGLRREENRPDIFELQAEIALRNKLMWTRWLLTGLACAGIGFGIVAVVNASRRIARPVLHLVDVARDISNGRARRRASMEESGEFAILAKAFNQMMDAGQQAQEKLRTAHDSLELKVSARTAELWRANKALREESEQRARAERDFLQAQKMDALGKLAGSIAHDFNNLLTVIIGGAECVRKQLGAHHPAISLLRTVEQAGERAAGLTRPLLTFSRNQVLSLEALDLNEAAREAGAMLQRLLGVNIDLRLNLASDLRAVKANANQIQQVLINLGVNARDAMEGAGVLVLTTRNANVLADVAERNGVAAHDTWVEVAVSDSGCGMDAATKARIFEPFFTTKPVGKGTGLGLATVFGIVKQCGGFLDVESAPGEGTTFRVFMPATAATIAVAAPAPEDMGCALEPMESGGETILLVDDEDDIRELASMTLEECGYRVLSAGNAEDALVLANLHAGEIRALVTDVIMPGMTGVQLANALSGIIPGVRVLFVSGHTNETISEDLLLRVHADYLQKPYLGGALAAKVRGVLSGAEAQLGSQFLTNEAFEGTDDRLAVG